MTDTDTDAELMALDALDLLEAAFTGDDDRFVALLPATLDAAELVIVAMAEQAQRLLESCARVPADGPDSSEQLAMWLQMIVSLQRLRVCGSDAVGEVLRGMNA